MQSVENSSAFQIYKLLTKKVLKYSELTLVKMVNINYLCHNYQFSGNPKRLSHCSEMILSLPTAKHRTNLMGFY